MGRKGGGRKPKYRSNNHVGGVAQDFGPQELWNKSVVVRGLGAEVVRHEVAGYVLRNRLVSEGGVVVGAGAFNRFQCPLDVLRDEGLLGDEDATKRRVEAAEVLYELWYNAGISGRTTATWNSAGGGGVREQDEWQAEDEMRYHSAVKVIGAYAPLVTAVCVQHKAPPGRTRAIEALGIGLDLLAAYFQRPRTRSSRHEVRVG